MKWLGGLFSGRTSRKAYALYWLLPSTLLTLGWSLSPWLNLAPAPPAVEYALITAGYAASLAVLAIDLVLGIRRFHDTNLSGWWFILAAFPIMFRFPIYALILISAQSFPVLFAQEGGPGTLPIAVNILVALAAAPLFWSLYRLCVRAGDVGPNRYGPDPLSGER
jgi:uncharacterized membrane protein YhaH (DUF805 family)